jgi:hypothetical protein
MSTIINATTTNGVVIQPDNSGSLQLATNSGTTAVTIDTSQNVGIGTASPQSKTSFAASSANYLTFQNSAGSSIYAAIGVDSGVPELVTGASANDTVIRTNQQLWFALSGGQAVGRFDSSANFRFNSGYGSAAIAYGCRAWVNFDGQGTVAIRASGNVSSITDNGTGDYTINFTTAMPDANYASVCMQNDYSYTSSSKTIITGSGAQTNQTTSSFRIYSGQVSTGVAGSAFDAPSIRVAIFR